jgi:hypothetical protein
MQVGFGEAGNLYKYVYTYIFIYIYGYVQICGCIYIYIYMYIYIFSYIFLYMLLGATVIAKNLADSSGGRLNLTGGGTMIQSIFGFCDIRFVYKDIHLYMEQ